MRQPKIRLTALSIQRLSKPGRYADGGGLYLQISKGGGKSWIYRFTINGRTNNMGLGPIHYITLAEARSKAFELKRQVLAGIDPLRQKEALRVQKQIEDAKNVTFDECAVQLIKLKKWKNLKHRDQWVSTLKTHASPVFGNLPVQSINNALIIKALNPIWSRIPETASRVRGRIEAVIAYATASGFRTGENPARWRGHLDAVFEKRSELLPVRHMPALPWREVPGFMAELRSKKSHSAMALELLVLTSLRPGELIGARASEFNFDEKIWTVPGIRMKKKVEHRVPLSVRAIEIAKELASSGEEILFPGLKDKHKPMSTNAILKLAKEMRPEIDITSHGFRSSFRDWAAEQTAFPQEVCEAALAHKIRNAVERAYRRGDLFLKRMKLMEAWSKYCESTPTALGKVLLLDSKAVEEMG